MARILRTHGNHEPVDQLHAIIIIEHTRIDHSMILVDADSMLPGGPDGGNGSRRNHFWNPSDPAFLPQHRHSTPSYCRGVRGRSPQRPVDRLAPARPPAL